MQHILYIAASVIAVLFVFVPHEFGHAFVAYKNGDCTAKMYGRLTLNPIKHIDPVGIVLCIFTGFGWAKPVPINPNNFRNYRIGLFTTAIAGVVVNYIIAFLAYPLYCLFDFKINIPNLLYFTYFFKTLFELTFIYSLSIFVFNLLPFSPLDGFRVVEAFTREINPIRRFLRNYGCYILIFLVVESFLCSLLLTYTNWSIIQYFDILGYVQWFAKRIIGFPISAFWNVIFGLPVNF